MCSSPKHTHAVIGDVHPPHLRFRDRLFRPFGRAPDSPGYTSPRSAGEYASQCSDAFAFANSSPLGENPIDSWRIDLLLPIRIESSA